MAKNKNASKEVKSKVPFSVFRKGAMALAVAGIMITSPLMFSGCAEDKGSVDTTETIWYSGTEYSAEEGKLGDFFYDTDDWDIYQKTNSGWSLISNIKGNDGARGTIWHTGSVITGTGASITATVENSKIGDLYLNTNGENSGNLYKCKANNTWEFITNINGTDGQTPSAPTVEIIEDYWHINGEPTGIKAEGVDGYSPEISIIDGKWAIDGVPTYQEAQGVKGDRGSIWLTGSLITGTGDNIEKSVTGAIIGDLYLNNAGDDAGNLYRCKAENTWEFLININGEDGESPTLPEIKIVEGRWMVGDKDMGPAVGKNGTVVSIVDGEWALDGEKQGISVRGATWTTGEGAPTETAEYIANDMYLDTINNVIYQYDGTTWNLVSRLKLTETLENYYYTINSETELLELIEKGAKCFKLGADITLTKKLTPKTDLTFDLNKHTIAYNGKTATDRLEIHAQNEKPINIVFKNGAMNFTNEANASTIVIDTGCSIRLENVHYTSNTTALFPRRDTTKVEVINSTIVAKTYAVGTNAKADENGKPLYAGIQIVLKDSILTTTSTDFDSTGVMINVPGSLNIENCEVTGDKQAVIARGGDTVIKNSKLVCTGEYLKANPTYQYQPTQIGFNEYEFSTWGTGNVIPCGVLVVGNNSTSYQYITNIELDNSELISKRIATPRIVAIGNDTPQDAEFIGVNVLMNGFIYDAEFMFTSVLGENLNIRTFVHSFEELETVLEGMVYGFNVVPVLARDLAIYNQNLYVEDYILIQNLISNLESYDALNGYSIYVPIFEATMNNQVTAKSVSGIDYAFNTLKSARVILDKPIYLTDEEKYNEYQELISQGKLIVWEYNNIYLVEEVETEAQLLTALSKIQAETIDYAILKDCITINTYECAVMYESNHNNVKNYEDAEQNYEVSINPTLTATVGTEAEIIEICNNAGRIGNIEVTLIANIQLNSNENNNIFRSAMESSFITFSESEFEVLPYFMIREVYSEDELINCLRELEYSYEKPKLMANISLTNYESNAIYTIMSEAGIIDFNGFMVTLFDESGEIPGDEISYIKVGSRDELIDTIESANTDEMIYIELTANIQLESEDDNTIITEFMRSEFAYVKYGPTNSEYEILPYYDEENLIEVSNIEEILAIVEGQDMETCETIYIRLLNDIIISAENQEILQPWYEAGKLIPINMDEFNFIPESEVE